MACEKCRECDNYMVCERGCYGRDKPCGHFHKSEE